MKADFLFVGLNLNTLVQKKTPETCTLYALNTSSIKNI